MERGELVSKNGKRGARDRERERERELTHFDLDPTQKPATLTRLQPLIPATSPTELGTDLKLEW